MTKVELTVTVTVEEQIADLIQSTADEAGITHADVLELALQRFFHGSYDRPREEDSPEDIAIQQMAVEAVREVRAELVRKNATARSPTKRGRGR